MRIYRFIDEAKKIDVTMVTDGLGDQEKVVVTDMKGIVAPGNVHATEDEKIGSNNLLSLGFKWNVGEVAMNEEIKAFAAENSLKLEISNEGGALEY